MQDKNKTTKSFTLIELLVVIAVIGLIASIVLVSLGSTRAKARDAKRKMDLTSIRMALALYYDKYEHYPREPFDGSYYNFIKSTRAQPWIRDEPSVGPSEGSLTEFIDPIPIDPINTNPDGPWSGEYNYSYVTNEEGQIYDLVALLENTNDPYTSQYQCWQVHVDSGHYWCEDGTPGSLCDICGGSEPGDVASCGTCNFMYSDHR